MYSVQDVISLVQSDINDLSMEKVQRGEYLALLRTVAIPIAQETKVYIGQLTATPTLVPDTNVYTVTFGTPNVTKSVVPNIFKFIQVRRTNNDGSRIIGNEYSKQAVAQTINELYPFDNYVEIGSGAFSTEFVNPASGLIDGTFTLRFPYAFQSSESITVDYISDMPTNLYSGVDKWELQASSPISIPNFLYNTFHYGLLERVIERLYLGGDARYADKVGYVSNKYKESLREAVAYSLTLKDESSVLRHQPYVFLPDGDSW